MTCHCSHIYAEGEDYAFHSVPPVINILSGMSRDCLTITIIQSDLVEDIENIDLLINETTTMANVVLGRTRVTIDADGSTKNNSTLYLFNYILQYYPCPLYTLIIVCSDMYSFLFSGHTPTVSITLSAFQM